MRLLTIHLAAYHDQGVWRDAVLTVVKDEESEQVTTHFCKERVVERVRAKVQSVGKGFVLRRARLGSLDLIHPRGGSVDGKNNGEDEFLVEVLVVDVGVDERVGAGAKVGSETLSIRGILASGCDDVLEILRDVFA